MWVVVTTNRDRRGSGPEEIQNVKLFDVNDFSFCKEKIPNHWGNNYWQIIEISDHFTEYLINTELFNSKNIDKSELLKTISN